MSDETQETGGPGQLRDDSQESEPIKVTDRRKFHSSGDLRDSGGEPQEAAAAESEDPPAVPAGPGRSSSGGEESPWASGTEPTARAVTASASSLAAARFTRDTLASGTVRGITPVRRKSRVPEGWIQEPEGVGGPGHRAGPRGGQAGPLLETSTNFIRRS